MKIALHKPNNPHHPYCVFLPFINDRTGVLCGHRIPLNCSEEKIEEIVGGEEVDFIVDPCLFVTKLNEFRGILIFNDFFTEDDSSLADFLPISSGEFKMFYCDVIDADYEEDEYFDEDEFIPYDDDNEDDDDDDDGICMNPRVPFVPTGGHATYPSSRNPEQN